MQYICYHTIVDPKFTDNLNHCGHRICDADYINYILQPSTCTFYIIRISASYTYTHAVIWLVQLI